ncbi:hypothetical protein NA56DRAFT_73747 [Hyaloscypha hepaticicola]|uniref:SRR1-like domain-containing protein n=1 Tax=Hyaloscypha hepaticicola TaxID=2082293 RepID=A0A2J6Q8Z5_9HELO|nr:hypothetical protein NA56DRAFT_73747 [Hyaloscypha hepaticicola]
MPHANNFDQPTQSTRTTNIKLSSSRETRQLHILYNKIQNQCIESNFSTSIKHLLDSKNNPRITRIVSLGLGSLTKSTDQSRRIKQLAILLAIAERMRKSQPSLEIYAQDPSFSKIDEAFLQTLDVHILSTSSATELGEAAQYIDENTLVYSPFLTLEAYELFFSTGKFNFFIGDDFDALRVKWPKHSSGWKEAESISRRYVQNFRKRVIRDEAGFWGVEDKPFPMAMYYKTSHRYESQQPKAKL